MSMISLRLLLQPENFPYELEIEDTCLVSELKEKLGEILSVARSSIFVQFLCQKEGTKDEDTLIQVGCKRDELNEALIYFRPASSQLTSRPSTKSVRIATPLPEPVKIVRDLPCVRPYEGGFINKATGSILLHTGVNCELDVPKAKQARMIKEMKQRDCQTAKMMQRSSQGTSNRSTQSYMHQKHIFIDNRDAVSRETDVKRYITAEQKQKQIERDTIKLQSFWRQIKSNRKVRSLFLLKILADQGSKSVKNKKEGNLGLFKHCKSFEDLEEMFLIESTKDLCWQMRDGDLLAVETPHVSRVREFYSLLLRFRQFCSIQSSIERDQMASGDEFAAEKWWSLLKDIQSSIQGLRVEEKNGYNASHMILQLISREEQIGRRYRCRSWKSRLGIRRRIEHVLKQVCMNVALSQSLQPAPETKLLHKKTTIDAR